MQALLSNQVLWTALLASTLAQVLKVLLILIGERKWMPERVLETGGMPSSHTASVAALAVMYDATGIRRASGMQAEVLNDLVQELDAVLREGFAPKPLKELLGHTYFEVFVGFLLGVGVAVASHNWY
jgi:uncharacterized protein